MKKIEGYVYKIDKNNADWYKNCKIEYPEKVPITLDFNYNNPKDAIGNGQIIRKEDGLYIKGEISDELYNNSYITHMGMHANVKTNEKNVITKMCITCVGTFAEKKAVWPECIIVRVKGDE